MEKLTLRLPEDLHREIKHLAEEDRRSLNAQIITLLEDAVKARRQ